MTQKYINVDTIELIESLRIQVHMQLDSINEQLAMRARNYLENIKTNDPTESMTQKLDAARFCLNWINEIKELKEKY